MNAQLDMFVTEKDKKMARELLKAYPSMKAAVEIFTIEKHFPEKFDYNEIDMANIEGRGTRGDIDGRGTRRDVVGNTIILREERPRMIQEYERKCKAVERALGALPWEGREIMTKCFFEQKRDKYIYEMILHWPKSTYDFHKNRAMDTVTFILKAAEVI
jgi:hypothetical protein